MAEVGLVWWATAHQVRVQITVLYMTHIKLDLVGWIFTDVGWAWYELLTCKKFVGNSIVICAS